MAASCGRKNCGSRECQWGLFSLIVLFLMLDGVVADSSHLSRNITIRYNEQCDMQPACNPTNSTTDSFNNLIHIIAVGPNDTLHYIWSSMGAPGVLLVKTSNKAKLQVDWDKLMQKQPEGLVFTPAKDVMYTTAFIFTKLIEYNDTKDEANLNLATEITETPLERLTWQNSNTTLNYTLHTGMFNMSHTAADAELGPNSTFAFKFQGFGSPGHSDTLPHLQTTLNCSQVEMILQNMKLHYKQSRFAVELLVMHDQNTKDNVTLSLEKSIDDEHTPSVFEILNLRIPSSSQQGSFSQWKPVTYNEVKKSMANAIQTRNYGVNTTSYTLPHWSVAHAFYSNVSLLHKASVTVSFGIPKDDFYIATNYTSWTISIGYGTPPDESVSLTIIIIIAVGLGLPAILILFGGIFITIKKKLSQNSEYESLDDVTPQRPINA